MRCKECAQNKTVLISLTLIKCIALFAQAPIICPAKISTIFISISDQNQLYGIYKHKYLI